MNFVVGAWCHGISSVGEDAAEGLTGVGWLEKCQAST